MKEKGMQLMNEKYFFDDYYCFNKRLIKGRLEKQLGDFGEHLIITILGRMKKYKVFHVDHEGADLIASEIKMEDGSSKNRYAFSVKAKQFGVDESQNYVFDRKNQIKLTKFAEDFKAIPVVAEVLIAKDFSFIDVFLIRLKDFIDLADESEIKEEELVSEGLLIRDNNGKVHDNDHQYPQLAIRWDKDKGLSLNNYVFNGRKKTYENNAYTDFLYNNARIQHMRISMDTRLDGTSLSVNMENERNEELLCQASDNDGNLRRQLGNFGEHAMAFVFSYMKGYKVAIVDHVGIDLIATKPNSVQMPYAISVKTMLKSGISYEYKFDEIEKIVDISMDLNYTPAVAYILPREKGNLGVFDFYFMTVDTLVKYAVKNKNTMILFGELEINIENYFKLAQERSLELSLEIKNDETFRKEAKEFPGIEHMEMHFPVMFDK